MKTKLSWRLFSVTAALLSVAISLILVQRSAASSADFIANHSLPSLQTFALQDDSQFLQGSPEIKEAAPTVEGSTDRAFAVHPSGIFTTSASGFQIHIPIIFKTDIERTTLMALYNGTQGDDWFNNTGWNTSSPICTWYGVTCDSANHVTSLVLENNNLKGSIPPGSAI